MFNPMTAKVLRDAAYSSRYILEDSAGRVAKKRKSHCATHSAVRFWTTKEAAERALLKMQRGQQ